MTSNAVETYKGPVTATLVSDLHYMETTIPRLAEQLARSSMCPDQFKGKPDDIAIIGYSLADLGVRLSVNTLPQMYVVHNRPAMMAQLQVSLAGRHNCRIVPLDAESDDRQATVLVTGKDGKWHRVTFTMDQAVRWGLPKKNPNYATIPDRMLMARATTKAIGQHCPEAKLFLAPTDLDELAVIEAAEATVEAAEQRPATERMVPARSVAPDGTTIPEHLREPAIDEDRRAELIAQLERLPEKTVATVQGNARDLGIPNLRSQRVTKAHGALVARLIAEAETGTATGTETVDASSVPADVRDGQPEAEGQLFDENDGRPFE